MQQKVAATTKACVLLLQSPLQLRLLHALSPPTWVMGSALQMAHALSTRGQKVVLPTGQLRVVPAELVGLLWDPK